MIDYMENSNENKSPKKETVTKKYASVGDFFRHASDEEKHALFLSAAQKATDDQRELLGMKPLYK